MDPIRVSVVNDGSNSESPTLQEALVLQLRMALLHRGWTQKDLARESGVSMNYVNQICVRRREGTLKTWNKLFATIGYSLTIELRES